MSRLIRPLSATCLALVLLVTSLSMALARAEMAVGGTMILCIGAEQVTVAVGADGQPVLEHHICPDCTIGALALLTGLADPVPSFGVLTLDLPRAEAAAPLSPVQGGAGRGPPA